MMRIAIILALVLPGVVAECPNSCSGHGECTRFDQCSCYPNWQSADCSERTCPFGLAHVDTPKGDLNGNGVVDSYATTAIKHSDVYPYGTTEQYPSMLDSNGSLLSNTAHSYMECSNKGLCDRKSGECQCFSAYEGTSCQRASCPNTCSGHGTCRTIRQLAYDDSYNVYELWDKDATMGCACDASYIGADCSLRRCIWGVDPLYLDDHVRERHASWWFHFSFTTSMYGHYNVRFFDVHGEDWYTEPISAPTAADACENIVAALEGLPNSVIPAGSAMCNHVESTSSSLRFKVTFTGNPGYLKEPKIEKYVYSNWAPNLYDANGEQADTVSAYVYQTGVDGEAIDYFASYCNNVVLTVSSTAISVTNTKLFKTCLGDSDGNPDNNVEVENWDYGDAQEGLYPHAVKLSLQNSSSDATGTIFALLMYNHSMSAFTFLHAVDDGSYDVFTTTGTAMVFFHDATNSDVFDNVTADFTRVNVSEFSNTVITHNVDQNCDDKPSGYSNCVQKEDLVFVFDRERTTADMNMFVVTKVWTNDYTNETDATRYRFTLDKHWGENNGVYVNVAKFTPPMIGDSSYYEYAAECSGRGSCDTSSALCLCFAGYTNDNCDTQSSLVA